MDFFENIVNPKRKRGTIIQRMLDTQYKVRYDGDKHTKVNTNNLVSVVITDDLEDSDDLDPTTGEIEEDTGSTNPKRPLRRS